MNRQLLFTTLLAMVAISACAAQPPRPMPMEKPGYSQVLLTAINQYRLVNSRNPLALDPFLTRLAQGHSQDMFNRHRQAIEAAMQRVPALAAEADREWATTSGRSWGVVERYRSGGLLGRCRARARKCRRRRAGPR